MSKSWFGVFIILGVVAFFFLGVAFTAASQFFLNVTLELDTSTRAFKFRLKRAKSTDRNKLTAKQRFRLSDFITDFVAVISSQSLGLARWLGG